MKFKQPTRSRGRPTGKTSQPHFSSRRFSARQHNEEESAESSETTASSEHDSSVSISNSSVSPGNTTVACSDISSESSAVEDGTSAWNADLNLSQREKDIVLSNDWANDELMNAAMALVPTPTNADPPTVLSIGLSDVATVGGYQFLNDGGSHWVLVSTVNAKIEIYDSLGKPGVHENVKAQLLAKFRTLVESNRLAVSLLPVAKQPNGNDCGFYAMAFLFELVNGGDPTVLTYYDVRKHAFQCFNDGKCEKFPSLRKRGRLAKPKTIFLPTTD